jgi:hypothetical protein
MSLETSGKEPNELKSVGNTNKPDSTNSAGNGGLQAIVANGIYPRCLPPES